ncbi:hypothetical protein MHM83_03235 [Tenacibaculum sp. Mcav3-52]|uniref:hypothetical protein n=1 Tax=Tenacibaculum sp. Mcav3-52 TaxID=2917762 RepID=UPI0012E481ED|nr:hypothetical protein [Tenacibaculum sp. Mcav3-52]MCG7500876.1 hypothetical protein [Tenacibaculum sp. Mcav3-52]GFD75474.1 hypothetical protein KUL113_48940 [Tenacibaculum sp. KUL113]
MELTKEQIEHIDTLLKTKGIKYWDLRIEMIDHIVSDVEENSTTNNFKIELEKSLVKLDWHKSLHKENQEGWKNVNKKYRKEYVKEVLSFFKSFRNVFIYTLFTFLYYFITIQVDFDNFKKLSLVFFLTPSTLFLFSITKQIMKQYGKSVNLDYGIFYFSFPFLMISLPLQLIKEAPENIQKLLSIALIPLFWVFSYAGYKVYKTAFTKVEKMKKELAL